MKIRPALSAGMVYTDSDGNKQCWIEEGFTELGDGGEVDGEKLFGALCKLCSMPRWANMRWHSSTLAAVPKSTNWRYKSFEKHVQSTLQERALNAIGKQHQQLVPLADSILKYCEVKSGPCPPPPDASANAAMTRVRRLRPTIVRARSREPGLRRQHRRQPSELPIHGWQDAGCGRHSSEADSP